MSKSKGLKTLIRLSKFNVDERRRVLVALQNAEDRVIAEIANHDARLKEEQKLAAQDATGVGFLYGSYHRAWMDRRENLLKSLAALREQIEAARDALADAYREQKTYEITQKERDRKEQQERDRKEQAFLDELGQQMHQRKQEEGG